LIASHGQWLYISRDSGSTWESILKLPVTLKTGLQSVSSITRRLFRQDIYHLVPIGDSIVVVFAFHCIYVLNLHTHEIVGQPTLIHGSRPLAVCRTPEGTLYYGEYCNNPKRYPIRILCSKDQGLSWEPIWEFSGVRHVHGVYYDPYENAIWVTTGDSDSESAIWISRDRFHSLDRMLEGSQQTRAIRLIFTSEHVYFGSDSPNSENYIYRLYRQTNKLEQLTQVGGPVFHGCKTASGLFFSTACEPSDVNLDLYAVVWHSHDGESWRPIRRYRKDILPFKLFQYGQVFFAEGQENTPGVWLTPFATRGSQQSRYIDEKELIE